MSSVYTDDSGWSDADTSSYDGSSASSTSVDVSEPGNAPEWMKKFSLSKISENNKKKQHSRSTGGVEDGKSSTSPTTSDGGKGASDDDDDDDDESSETSVPLLDSTQNSAWLAKFENAKDGKLVVDPPLAALSDTGELEIFNDYDSSSRTSSANLDSTQNSAWLKRFESAKKISRAKETRDASTQTMSSNRSSSRKHRKYRKSRAGSVDKAERRKRIRDNLAKIRRRERIRGNLDNLKSQKENERKETSTQTMPATKAKRSKKQQKALSDDTDSVEISPPRGYKLTVDSKRSESEIDSSSQKKIENKWGNIQQMWNNMKSPMQTPSTFQQKQRASSFGNTHITANRKTSEMQQKSKGKIVKASPYSHQKGIIDAPSIKSKVNALQNAIEKSNTNEFKPHSKNETKASSNTLRAPAAQPHHTYSPYRQVNAIEAKATHQKADRLTNEVPKNQINESKPPPKNAEIENTVPENLFGMWGDTVKAKKPITGANAYSARKVKEQANLVKQKIQNAKKGPADETKVAEDDAAAALFNAAGSKTNTEEDYRHFEEEEDAAALFHGAGAKKKTEEGYIYNLDFEEEEDDDAAALFHAAGATKNKSDAKASEISNETSMDDNAAALFFAAGANNDSSQFSADESETMSGPMEYKEEFEEDVWEEGTISDDSDATDDSSNVALDSADDTDTNSGDGPESSYDDFDEEPSLCIDDLINEGKRSQKKPQVTEQKGSGTRNPVTYTMTIKGKTRNLVL